MQTVEMFDWKKMEMHYSQYSPEELEEMCALSYCPKGMTKKEFEVAIKRSYQDFLAQFPNNSWHQVGILSTVMEEVRYRTYGALQKIYTWHHMKMERRNG